MKAPSYTRDDLIALCEQALVPEGNWRDRDSESAQRQIGECWALLRAGCPWRFETGKGTTTNAKTIWIVVESKGFMYFEDGAPTRSLFYIPTPAQLREASGRDWY